MNESKVYSQILILKTGLKEIHMNCRINAQIFVSDQNYETDFYMLVCMIKYYMIIFVSMYRS